MNDKTPRALTRRFVKKEGKNEKIAGAVPLRRPGHHPVDVLGFNIYRITRIAEFCLKRYFQDDFRFSMIISTRLLDSPRQKLIRPNIITIWANQHPIRLTYAHTLGKIGRNERSWANASVSI
ncbi:MAG: hypothetical protein VB034_06055 [Eubacteriales bacterium]|nr:hypothetical protein [Eubacteriales bacterium]